MIEFAKLRLHTVRPAGSFCGPRYRRGFTLIELTVALAIFLLLLVIVFVPLNQALLAFNAGRAEINLQSAAQQTMAQIKQELQHAVYVYPNDVLPSVTDAPPYSGATSVGPYYASTSGTCSFSTRTGNRSRLDFIPAKKTGGEVDLPAKPDNFIVTYYARRLRAGATDIYDKIDNPVSLFRAQMPYRYPNGLAVSGMATGASRYPASSSTCDADWLKQQPSQTATPSIDNPDEPNLEADVRSTVPKRLTDDETNGSGTTYGGHTAMIPRGTGLTVADNSVSMSPETSFVCDDTDGDGKIDRVTVNLVIEQYEASSAASTDRAHIYRASQVIDLPNIH